MDQGKRPSRSYVCTQWVFLRALGLVYFCAFLSLVVQGDGLIGSRGILPAADYLARLSPALPDGMQFFAAPTLCWWNSSDACLQLLAWGGTLAGLGIALGVAQAPLLIGAWLFYLSLVTVGQDFLSFQWDSLLLETGFLAMFWCPWRWLVPPWKGKLVQAPPTLTFNLIRWLLRLLLFRLMLFSGAVKLLSGDATWQKLTALNCHYFTQPLPTPLAWLINQMPSWFQSLSVAGVFLIELGVPFLFFCPRRWRLIGAALTALLQVIILLTGNYAFFNMLTLALCLTLLDDDVVKMILPQRWLAISGQAPFEGRVRTLLSCTVTAVVLFGSGGQFVAFFSGAVPEPFGKPLTYMGAFHLVNHYGLFAVMTTSRPEIEVQGSDDGVNWQPYVFKYKVGPLDRPPPLVAPHQPRLDWQMWFAALGRVDDSPWFVQFAYRLLQGSPQVVQLLEVDPFHGRAPKYVRAMLYQYEFTTSSQWLTDHQWWKRTPAGEFMPALSLENFSVR